MQNTINSILKYTIIIGLAIIPFLPLYIANELLFPFITGKAFAFRIIVEIIFAIWLILVLRERGTSVQGTEKGVAPHINGLSIFVSIFVFFILIADLAGLNPLRSIWSNFERMEGWMTLIHLWAYFIVLSSVIKGRENWNKFFDVVLLAGFITSIYGLSQFFGWAEIHQGSTRVDASLGNSAYMAVFMLLNAFLAAFMAFTNRKTKAAVWIYSVLAFVFSFVMFQTATRGTILGWIAGIIISCALYAIFNKDHKKHSKKIASGIIILFVLLGVLFYFNRNAGWIQKNLVLNRLATISLSDTKTQARGFIWPMAVKGIFESPKTAIIGIGQENFNYIFNSHYDPRMWAHEQWFDRAHSVFLDWLVAGGLIGLALYLSLYIIALIYIWKSDLNIGQKSVLIGLMFGYGIHNIFVFDNQTSYIMFFTILAYIHSFRAGKNYKWLGHSTKAQSEDAIVVRDYVYVPVIVILFITTLYFISIRPIQSNTRLISALKVCATGQNLSADIFDKALKMNQTVANQEIREQFYSCALNVFNPQMNVSIEEKEKFYQLARRETDNQIKFAPNDARGYIIAGGFYDSIGDLDTARPLLEKAHELSPNKQTIIYELASNYINSGKTTEALAMLESAYESATENTDARKAYVVGLISAGQSQKAEQLFADDASIFLDQRVVNAYVASKQFNRVIDIYKKALVNEPNNQNLYSALATAYLMNGQNTQAIQVLRSALEKFPALKDQIESIIKQIQDGTIKF